MLLGPQSLNRIADGYLRKAYRIARPQLADAIPVGGNHVSNLGIASGRLLIDEQDNGLPVLRHLNGAQRDAVSQQLFGFAQCDLGARESKASTV